MSTDRLTGAGCARPENVGLPWISENASAAAQAHMSGVCAACPVAAACAREVAVKETTAGFWAGADRTTWQEVSASDLFAELSGEALTGRPVQGTLPFDLPGLDAVEVAA
ncbi:hypothetical protein C8K30_10316 [Promicromonospora sp. AC04]|uniref:WhiB family transcriptional regulator n=1 Tax=Promicromonospora sp. AC04 TaxID=2135723 RepID=UPI000D379303|nr:WhiB family transcriptional regulator [Promicromonospora sp. AC04]PUB28600.1 hypothetical protein C8K30_10316 [Promicromonospora sp. AC04]